MELTSRTPLRGTSSRTWSLAAAAVAAIVAGILVVSAINDAKKDAGAAAGATSSVVVADRLIAKGSSGEAIASEQSFRISDVRSSAVVAGAVTDISQVRDKVATKDIYPGQQVTTADFASGDGALATKLARNERALAVPVDTAHGLVGEVRAGDRVDVLAGFNLERDTGRSQPVLKPIASNVVVLKAPKSASAAGGSGQNGVITLKVRSSHASRIAFAADNGKVWVVLRAPGSTRPASSQVVSASSLLVGVTPVGEGSR